MAVVESGSARDMTPPDVATRLGLDTPLPAPAQRAVTFGLLISALRCILQYVVLPFVLPWAGLASAVPTWLVLALCVIAILALARNTRTLWRLRHARRWSYLMLAAIVGGSLIIFAVVDVHTLLHV